MMEKYRAQFDKQMKEIFALVPYYQKFLKDAKLERNNKVQAMEVLNHECSAITQEKVVNKKLDGLGSFTLPFFVSSLAFKN